MSDALAAVSQELDQLQAQRYTRVSPMALIIYDILLTMDREILYFWRKSFSVVQVIYFLNRYFGLFLVVVEVGDSLIPISTTHLCNFSFQFEVYTALVAYLLAQAVMCIRVHALYSRSKFIFAFLLVLYIMQGAAMLGVEIAFDLSITIIGIPALTACDTTTGTTPFWIFANWIPPIFFELILLSLTLYKAYEYYHMSSAPDARPQSDLMRVFVRDQICYFIAIVLAGTVTMFFQADPAESNLINIALNFTLAVPCIIGSRLLLNLKEVGEKKVYAGSRRLDITDPEFSTVEFA